MSKTINQPTKISLFLQRKDNSPLLLGAAAAALLIGLGGIASWFLIVKPQQDAALPTGARLVPPDAWITTSVTTDVEQWKNLRALGTTQSRTVLDQALLQWRDRLLDTNNLNYQTHIQPWVGQEITVALMPGSPAKAKPPATNSESMMIAVLPIANAAEALQSLKMAESQPGQKWKERTYQGMTLRERQGTPNRPLAMTVINNQFLVVGTTSQLVEQVIDTHKQGTSIADAPGYQAAWGSIQTESAFAKIFVNVPAAVAGLATGGASPVPPDKLAQRQPNQGLAATATLLPKGMLFQGVSWLTATNERKLSVQNNARLMPSLLPANTYMLLSGGNLQQLWQDYGQDTQNNPLAPIPPDRLRDGLKTLTGLDFDKDFLSWAGGEFGLAFIAAAPNTTSRSTGTGVALLVQASDRRTAEGFFQKLDQAVSTRYQFQVKPTTSNNQAVVNWSDKDGRLMATHGWLDNNVAFISVGAPVTDTFVPKPKSALAENNVFAQGVPTLSPNNGHFFLNVEQTLSNPMPILPFLPSANPLLQAMQTVGVTTAIRDERSNQFKIQLQMKQSGEMPTLPAPGENPAKATSTPAVP
jgi:hypothetical protein